LRTRQGLQPDTCVKQLCLLLWNYHKNFYLYCRAARLPLPLAIAYHLLYCEAPVYRGFVIFVYISSFMSSQFYALTANTPQGNPVSMEAYKGKVVLVVNTATQCGLTPQFEGLERLYEKYRDKGLVVLGFPCNQFGGQEPLANEVMEATCQLNHGVTFPLFQKIEVNGPGTHPIFGYLKKQLGGLFGSRIKWNFTKFLIDPVGKPVQRFSPVTKPEAIEGKIRELLGV
jgi:glutathione peroxidase